ncbi:hypothetical protein BC629DRAFT_1484337 [Irpex lacteus]|nr:hypothetical protein BC629DRAFT_1484337 [Irpex lacteus]
MSTGRFDKSKKPYSVSKFPYIINLDLPLSRQLATESPKASEGNWVHDKAPGSNIAKTPRVQADTPNVAKGNSTCSQARRVTSAPSLINRIQSRLGERLGAADTKPAVAPAHQLRPPAQSAPAAQTEDVEMAA